MLKNKHILPIFSALLFFFQSNAQEHQLYEVRGRVVEVTDGKPVGIPEVKVNVQGHFDITDQQGRFRLLIKSGDGAATITLQDCDHPLISPRGGKVNLPPSNDLLIRVCSKQNRRLQQQVDELEKKVTKAGQKYRLSQRQLAEMYERMMDTVVHFEREILDLEKLLDESQSEKEELNRKRKELEQSIEELKQENSQLQDELRDALAEKYLRQNEYFEEISSAMNEYISTLYDFKDKLPRIAACYSNRGAYSQMEAAKKKYSDARDHIDSRHDAWVAEVRHYWDAPEVAEQLTETCHFLLQKVHDERVYTMNEDVFGPMKDWAMDKTSQNKARKKSEAAVETALPELNTLTAQLETKIAETKAALQNSL